jgi:hypothetical protein
MWGNYCRDLKPACWERVTLDAKEHILYPQEGGI